MNKYYKLIENLMPQGPLWNFLEQPVLRGLLTALAEGLKRADLYAQKLLHLLVSDQTTNDVLNLWRQFIPAQNFENPADSEVEKLRFRLSETNSTSREDFLAVARIADANASVVVINGSGNIHEFAAGGRIYQNTPNVFRAGDRINKKLKEQSFKRAVKVSFTTQPEDYILNRLRNLAPAGAKLFFEYGGRTFV